MKFLHHVPIALIGLALAASACSDKKSDDSQKGMKVPANPVAPGSIAYVDLDTLEAKYQFFIDTKAALEAKSNQYEAEITRLGKDFEQSANTFQQKLQSGGYASEEQARSAQQAVVNKQNNLQKKQMEYAEALQKEQEAFNKALHDSVSVFIKEYNKSRKFTMILSKIGDNILYAAPSTDITADVVAGLNKRYQKK